MFNFLQKESDQGRLLSKINPNYSKAKSHGIRASEPLAVTWIKRPNSRVGLVHSPLSAGVIGLSSLRRYETFTMIKPSLDPEEEEQSLSANWGDNITKIAPVSISDSDVIGNVLGIVSLAEAKSLGLIFDNQDAREPYVGATRTHKWSMPAMPVEFAVNEDTEASTEESDIPVLAVIPKTLIVEFGSEILTGKVIFKDAMACLQSSHENAAIIGSAWDFLQHEFNSKSIHVAPDFQWSCLDKTFAEKAKTLVQENLLMSHSMLRPDSTDYKVIEVEAGKAIKEALNSYLADNPEERQGPSQQTQTQGQAQGQPDTPTDQNVDPRNQKTWETMFRAMQSVSTESKTETLETSKYAIAFFKILTMSETTENDTPNDGQTSEFEVTDINRLLKAGISSKLKNMNTWNMQKEHFRNAMAEKENLPYQNLKSLLNNAAFMVKLKGYDFMCSSLKMNSNCENISLGSFAPMDEDSNTFKEMKQNNEDTNMQHQLGHKGENCTKASTKVWFDWRVTSWHRLLQILQNANIEMLFWSYNGVALTDTSSGHSMTFKRPYICVRLEHLYRILACEKIKKWARDTGKVHKHLAFTVATRIQTILGKFWAACSDLANIELVINGTVPARNNSLFKQVDSSFNSLINDICTAQEGDNAGQLSFPPCTFEKYCDDKEKKRKRADEPEKSDHSSARGGNYQDKAEGKKTKWADKPEKSERKERSTNRDSANKNEGIWKLSGDKLPAIKDLPPPFITFRNEKRPPCMKGCSEGLSCTYSKCNFHHICSKDDLDSLAAQDRKILNKYTAAEAAIDWCQDCKPGKSATKVLFKSDAVEIVDSSSTEDEDIVEARPVTKAASKSKKSKV
jgi:hypothetical protein